MTKSPVEYSQDQDKKTSTYTDRVPDTEILGASVRWTMYLETQTWIDTLLSTLSLYIIQKGTPNLSILRGTKVQYLIFSKYILEIIWWSQGLGWYEDSCCGHPGQNDCNSQYYSTNMFETLKIALNYTGIVYLTLCSDTLHYR